MDKLLEGNHGMFRWRKDATRSCWIVRYAFSNAVISYSPDENLVVSLVMESLGGSSTLIRNIQAARAYFCHPMLVPTLLLTESINHVYLTTSVEGALASEVDTLEKNVGLREGFRENEDFLERSDEAFRVGTDLRARNKNLLGKVTNLHSLSKSVLKAARCIDDLVGSMDAGSLTPGPDGPTRRSELARCARAIEDRVEGLIAATESLTTTLDNLQERSALQMTALYNIFAQRDSRANIEMAKVNTQMAKDSARLASAAKRDSSSMKTIAILTTVFLPGTFVSALFSTPMVESDPSNIWVYWAITIPLTALVIGIWAAWMFWSDRRNKVQDEGAADAVGSDESKQKGAKSEKND